MRVLFFLILLFYVTVCFIQEGYSVIYKYDEKQLPFTFNGERRTVSAPTERLVFNDSLSFWYRIQKGTDPLRKRKIFENKLLHHALLFNFN